MKTFLNVNLYCPLPRNDALVKLCVFLSKQCPFKTGNHQEGHAGLDLLSPEGQGKSMMWV